MTIHCIIEAIRPKFGSHSHVHHAADGSKREGFAKSFTKYVLKNIFTIADGTRTNQTNVKEGKKRIVGEYFLRRRLLPSVRWSTRRFVSW